MPTAHLSISMRGTATGQVNENRDFWNAGKRGGGKAIEIYPLTCFWVVSLLSSNLF